MKYFSRGCQELVEWLQESDQTADLIRDKEIEIDRCYRTVLIRLNHEAFDIVEYYETADGFWLMSLYKYNASGDRFSKMAHKTRVPTGPAPGVLVDFLNGERWAVSG